MSDQITSKHTLRDHEAAEFLSVSTATLRAWRAQNRGPSFSRLGRRIVYPLSALERFVRDNLIETGAR
jgi:predicted DNA-binding transcriptional regulator AlpA